MLGKDGPFIHTLSVVVPVYQGEDTLPKLIAEITPLTAPQRTPSGHSFRVIEVVLVHDDGPDRSAEVIRSLAAANPFVRAVFLSRNYGQHAASLAGMASTSGEWVATLDEDGQYSPADLALLFDGALRDGVHLAYGIPQNPPPHGVARNMASKVAKSLFRWLIGPGTVGRFSSFRVVWGEVARSLAAYCGSGVYLDVALAWVVGRAAHCPITARQEGRAKSGYTTTKLLAHFWRMVLTSGTRPLKLIALLGVASVLFALGLAGWALRQKLVHNVPVQGWTSLVVIVSFFFGAVLFSLGVIAEYLGLAASAALGRPLYLMVSRSSREPVRRS